MSINLRRLAAGMAFTLLAAAQAVAAPTPVRFVLDWKLQGVHAWYYLAEDRGYFKDENLAVRIDQGDGSANTVTKVMAGVYDAGFGDVNAIIQNAATRPQEAPVMAYLIYNRAPFALVTRADSPIRSLEDLEGRKLGSPAGGAAMRMFDTLAALNGIDAGKVEWVNMAPNLQEQMLLRGEVDASAVFSVTSYANLLGMRQDPDQGFRWFHYADHGVELYGNGVMVSRKLLAEQPAVAAGLIRAIHRGLMDTIADPDAAIEALARREPLIDREIEKERLRYTLQNVVFTDEVRRIGLGDIDDARMQRAIAQVVDVFGLPATPTVDQVFSRAALPPRDARLVAP
ncbi:ABC transporter substrate-binding protein [Verticiella sediminum]|uniref:Thiamine pyrimidine synthase n=1 Tax=Verticiella sediminum TaxID=1247510 RepID=A0A556A999_9BURK|nr:ABC transporter substrate-binding protein [Verticiella sediminum]TSH89463.1 ABC transporter substrate-binding protein [Verticiella sediminum]